MIRLILTDEYVKDIKAIKDDQLSVIVTKRLERLMDGNFGDTKYLGDGVSELRIHYGAGYRIYYTLRGSELVILLCSGDKSDQKRDLEKAKRLAKEVGNE